LLLHIKRISNPCTGSNILVYIISALFTVLKLVINSLRKLAAYISNSNDGGDNLPYMTILMLKYCLKIEKQLLYSATTSKVKLYKYGLGGKAICS